jgi:phosphoglycolate phosphatase-like HAD superfamily hydrolase
LPHRHMSDFTDRASLERVYCFDFDGVLCDSMDESLLTSYNAYFQREAKSVSEIDPAIRDFFYEHRYLVRPGMEFCALFYAFERGERIVGEDRFLQLKAALTREMKDYAESFYAYRKRFKKDMAYWLGLHRLYTECLDFLEQRNHRFCIVTNKDRDSVVALARHHGYLNRIIEIYSREIGINKRELLEKLIENHGLNPSTHRIIFVDDHEGTLGELRELPLELYLAAWGYTRTLESSSFRLIHSLGELP